MLLIICVMIGIIVAGDMILGVLINTFVEVIYQKYDIEQLSKMKKVESIYQNKADVFGADFTKILIDTYMNHEGRSYEDTMLEVIHRPLNPWIISFLIATYKGKHLVSSSEEAGWLSTSYEDPRKSIRGIKVKVKKFYLIGVSYDTCQEYWDKDCVISSGDNHFIRNVHSYNT